VPSSMVLLTQPREGISSLVMGLTWAAVFGLACAETYEEARTRALTIAIAVFIVFLLCVLLAF